ncbi:nudix hydrolase 1 [Microthyrium microscopicum]|uniref:Nudix hydrolase 1 n=1 Tax=Microthyrium microscopicum TaxID=703497 RepID=A0A6A6ULA8_9PEZI|nr:nudix hydrolase 1 [Microthyrium microscopicum]
MAEKIPIPRVGIGLFCFRKNGTFLAGRRKGSLGAGTYALPGGHLEFGESFEDCVTRELAEETGLQVTDLAFLTTINTVFEDAKKHYVTTLMGGYVIDEAAEPKVMEPEKCYGWEWVTWEDLKSSPKLQPVFKPLTSLVEQRPGFDPLVVLKASR